MIHFVQNFVKLINIMKTYNIVLIQFHTAYTMVFEWIVMAKSNCIRRFIMWILIYDNVFFCFLIHIAIQMIIPSLFQFSVSIFSWLQTKEDRGQHIFLFNFFKQCDTIVKNMVFDPINRNNRMATYQNQHFPSIYSKRKSFQGTWEFFINSILFVDKSTFIN